MKDRGPTREVGYDTAVAKRLLATTANEFLPRTLPGRDEAGDRLIADLVRVANGFCEWVAQSTSLDRCLLTLPEIAQLSVRHDRDGVFVIRQVQPTTAEPRTLRLFLNPETELLEGKDVEEERTPVPGAMRVREDGLAIVLRTAIDIIRESSTAEM